MKNDRERLHKLAKGKIIVMGERTYQAYKDVKEAFNTQHVIVLSHSLKYLDDAEVVHELDEIVERAKSSELWVIGGGSMFKQLMPYASKMHLTEIDGEFEADTFFPEYDTSEWELVEKLNEPADQDNPYSSVFVTYQRKQPHLV